MARREIGEINAGSMADIAFLLLIFFLVTTTMDVDTGISRMLPPIPEENQEQQKEIKERNVFTVLINSKNQLLVKGKLLQVDELKEAAKEFIVNPKNDIHLPEKELREIPYFGEFWVTKGVISLQNDRGTRYGMYIAVQNELAAAFNEVRDELSMQKFSKRFDDLMKDQQEAIRKIYPLAVSEAEPKNIGGGN
jgi:biopolymer transport protein ExbD